MNTFAPSATGSDEFNQYSHNLFPYILMCGPYSSVSIVTAYGLDGLEIESRWWRDFPHPSRTALRPTQPPVSEYRVFPGGKVRPGRDADPSPPSSA
jgi:hypothetical protein